MTPATDLLFRCATCGGSTPAGAAGPRCTCTGLFEPRVYRDNAGEASSSPQRPSAVSPSEIPGISELGAFATPLLRRTLGGSQVYVKYEAVLPTGSYKDRGARTLIGTCRALGVPRVVEDSSGNAGAAIAAYAAAAGIEAEIFVQHSAAPAKVRQIAAYGARVTAVSGSREDVARAAREEAAGGAAREAATRIGAGRDETGRRAARAAAPYYASHVYNPLFIAGVQSAADEIVEEIAVPDVIYLPVGNGALILGLAEGFRRRGGLPRFVAVQAGAVSPIYDAWRHDPTAAASPGGSTIADGVAVAAPARLQEIVAVVSESAGAVVTVSDEEIRAAQRVLAETGLYAEPTGALAAAGYLAHAGDQRAGAAGKSAAQGPGHTPGPRHTPGESAVVFLTGSGLKEQP